MSDSVIQPHVAPAGIPAAAATSPPQAPAPADKTNGSAPSLAQDQLTTGTPLAKGIGPATGVTLSAAKVSEAPAPAPKKDDGWKVRFNFGFTRTQYFNSDVKMRTPLMNIDVKDMKWQERTCVEAYDPRTWTQFMDAGRWIDEPTNTFQLTATKGKNEFIFSAFHPKYLIDQSQSAHVTGDVGGVPVNGVMPLNESYEGAGGQPGRLHMTEVRNTHQQMDFQLGYGREVELFHTKGNHSLVYRPAVYAGVMMGKSAAKYETAPGEVIEIEDKTRIHGATAAIGNKLELRVKDRVSLMAEHKLSGAVLKQRLYGGTMDYKLGYSTLTFGVGVKLWDDNKHRK